MIFCSLFCDIIFLILILFSVHRKALLLGYIFCLFFAYLCYCAFLPVFVLLIYKQIYIYIGGDVGHSCLRGVGMQLPFWFHHPAGLFFITISPFFLVSQALSFISASVYFIPPFTCFDQPGGSRMGRRRPIYLHPKGMRKKNFSCFFIYFKDILFR